MTNVNDVRCAHDLLDELDARAELSQEQEKLLRSFLPELPKQKTLEEIYKYVDDAWLEADDPESKEWLHELHVQLQGLKDAPAATPALPAGMRLADHAERGRVVVSPTADEYDDYRIFYLNPHDETGAKSRWASVECLTFIDAEPAKPARPEFLEAEADYRNAPGGTIAAMENAATVWVKKNDWWLNTDGDGRTDGRLLRGVPRKVLRWGDGK